MKTQPRGGFPRGLPRGVMNDRVGTCGYTSPVGEGIPRGHQRGDERASIASRDGGTQRGGINWGASPPWPTRTAVQARGFVLSLLRGFDVTMIKMGVWGTPAVRRHRAAVKSPSWLLGTGRRLRSGHSPSWPAAVMEKPLPLSERLEKPPA